MEYSEGIVWVMSRDAMFCNGDEWWGRVKALFC